MGRMKYTTNGLFIASHVLYCKVRIYAERILQVGFDFHCSNIYKLWIEAWQALTTMVCLIRVDQYISSILHQQAE